MGDELPDSGQRTQFGDNGAVRETQDKPAMHGISPHLMIRLGTLLSKADVKYSESGGFRNYERGLPFSTCVGGILRHTFAFLRRDTSEDHLAAIAWNAMAMMHYEGQGIQGLDDRPVYSGDGRIILDVKPKIDDEVISWKPDEDDPFWTAARRAREQATTIVEPEDDRCSRHQECFMPDGHMGICLKPTDDGMPGRYEALDKFTARDELAFDGRYVKPFHHGNAGTFIVYIPKED